MRNPLAVVFLTLAAPALAQEPEPGPLPEWRIPIHTGPDDPVGGAYGIWACGPDYKVSFHDGFTFYPVLGKSYPEHLPLRWKTESITMGGVPVTDTGAPARATHTDWRYEYHYPGVVEAYDVRREGVEQTFTLTHRPATAGDLVVTGRMHTELVAADRAPSHDRLVFRDDRGNPLVEYGAAVAVDAGGGRRNMTTSISGGEVRLTLDAAWLDRAIYPVTVDPLTASVAVGVSVASARECVDVAYGEADTLFVVESRPTTGGDYDSRGWVMAGDFTNQTHVFSDITSAWGTQTNQVAFVGGADRWVVAFQRSFSSTLVQIRAYFHDSGDTTLNSGTIGSLGSPGGFLHIHPSVGGTAPGSSGNRALIAYQERSTTNVFDSRIKTILADASTRSFVSSTGIYVDSGSIDARYPSVQRASDGGSSSWVLVWQRRSTLSLPNPDDFDVRAARIRSDGTLAGTAGLGPSGIQPLFSHKTLPKVDGRQGRYLAAFTQQDSNRIWVQRFWWPVTATTPTVENAKVLHAGSDGELTGWTNRAVAHDWQTQSHWTVCFYDNSSNNSRWYATICRVGLTGGLLESTTLTASTSSADAEPSVCFNPDRGEFPAVFIDGSSSFGARMQYDPAAGSSVYGFGCNPGTISMTNNGQSIPPYTGSEFLRIHLKNGVPNATTILALSASPGAVLLSNGCPLNLGAPILNAGAVVSNFRGETNIGPFPMPDDPIFFVDLYWQWVQIDPTTNAVSTTQGLVTSHR